MVFLPGWLVRLIVELAACQNRIGNPDLALG